MSTISLIIFYSLNEYHLICHHQGTPLSSREEEEEEGRRPHMFIYVTIYIIIYKAG